ncbi:MAG: class I SAM-dependent methyltransferase [Deltaproteobacteria bacterium]|nr:class I SAM-dependent methyltransferase [Deltaproteobacteria bacterium]MBW2154319.1 class I SAM-dependent methyltransferase [Deltaproteobacteria bacterium]
MGYVFDFKDSREYQQLMSLPANRATADHECRLMLEMLNPLPGNTILDIGCGLGLNFSALLSEGLQITGIDPSPYMLDIAKKKATNRIDLHRGYAEDLPFEDNSFNYSCLTSTLEFVEDPQRAIEEACRVAKDRIFLGFLNRYAINGIQLRVKGVFTKTIYNHARFFSVWELKRLVRSLMGDVPISWRTACQLPQTFGGVAEKIEQISAVQRCPFGAYVGMTISLMPRFRTKPMPLGYRPKRRTGVVTG